MIASVHNEIDQSLTPSAALDFKSRIGWASMAIESIACRVLAYVMIRILRATLVPLLAGQSSSRKPAAAPTVPPDSFLALGDGIRGPMGSLILVNRE